MKKMTMTMAMIGVVCTLSSCGKTEDLGNTQTNVEGSITEISEENPQMVSDETETDAYEGESHDYDVDAKLEYLPGEYDYSSDYGTGKLTIEKTSNGYDISDYESESSYRFLADSSNIETIEDNRIYMKYPEQVSSDGTAVFGYYILEYGTDEIDVYYGKSSFNEAEFLYHATKKIASADELLDSFLNGSISAVDSTDLTSVFYITDLNMDSGEWDSYSVGERVDLDNDGENELIICGPYGGIYFDARGNKVYKFAAAEGTALVLSYAEAYAALKRAIHRAVPQFDGNALDAARFLFGSDVGEVVWHEGWINIDEEVLTEAEDDFDVDLPATRGPITEGNRNNALSHFAGKILKKYGEDDGKAREIFLEEAARCDPPLEDGELNTICFSALKFFRNKVSNQSGYVPPGVYNDDFGGSGDSLKPPDYSDIGQAKVLKREYGNELRFSEATDYLRYNGNYWQEDHQMAVGAVEEFLDHQLADAQEEMARAKKAMKDGNRKKD